MAEQKNQTWAQITDALDQSKQTPSLPGHSQKKNLRKNALSESRQGKQP